MKNLRIRIDLKLVNNEKDYLNCISETLYMSHKIFDNNIVAIRQRKLGLKLTKPEYIGMYILVMYQFHYHHIKNIYDNKSKLLFTDTDTLMYEIKTEDVYEDFSNHKEIFDFSNYWAKSKYYDDSKKLVIGKMKDQIGGAAIEEFVGWNPKMYLFLPDNNEHKKTNRVNRNIVTTICNKEYKDVLLNSNKCLRHTMNSIQSADHRIGTHKNNKIFLSCFDGKIHIQNNEYDGLTLGYQC